MRLQLMCCALSNLSSSQFTEGRIKSDYSDCTTRSSTSTVKKTKFYDVKDLIDDQGDIAVIIEENPDTVKTRLTLTDFLLHQVRSEFRSSGVVV